MRSPADANPVEQRAPAATIETTGKSRRTLLLGGALLTLAGLGGCAVDANRTSGRSAPPPATPVDVVVRDGHSDRALDWAGLKARLLHHPIVLLGERHDNSEHHRLRARLLASWLGAWYDRLPLVVFEQLDREHDAALQAARLASPWAPADGEAIVERWLGAARFDRAVWRWPLHEPLFAAAAAGGGQWVAGNFSRASARALMRPAASGRVEPDVVLVDSVQAADWPDEARLALLESIRVGHCDKLPSQALPGVARMQQLRDAALALAMQPASGRPALLIAGNGHVRRDHGVPRYLGRAAEKALVVGFEEHGSVVPAGRYDLVVFVRPQPRESSGCEGV